MKFAILTDIHLGAEATYKGVLRKINKDAKIFLDKFVEEINNNIKPEFVVILGDLIEDCDSITDKKNVRYIIKLLKNLKCPVHYVTGNHDLKNISEDELANLFNQDKLYYSFDLDNIHSIVLFSKRIEKEKIIISEEQKKWLTKDLKKTNKKCIIFVHHSLADQNLKGNPWFEGAPTHCLIDNRVEIRKILEKSNKVIAVFNSHLHWDKKHVHNNIPYFTIQSLVENEDNKGIASETHAIVNITKNKVDVEIKGNYPKKL